MSQLLPKTPSSTETDIAACRAAIRVGSRSFYAASLLLPSRVRDPAYALYAFCRFADDVVDMSGADADAPEQLRARLQRIYAGQPFDAPADRALVWVTSRFSIPYELLDALIEGFEWDSAGTTFEDLSDLQAYAARVAGTVGAMMALIMGTRCPQLLARASDLGIAMQLTNIARDVGEDARAGRIYLPLSWLREAGIDPQAWLENPEFNPEIGSVVQRLLNTADTLYERAASGIAGLEIDCRPAIFAASFLYAEIGREVERSGLNSVDQRAIVLPRRQIVLLARATLAAAKPRSGANLPALPQARFLVDAVVETPAHTLPIIPWWRLGERIIWVIELFERLGRHEQSRRVTNG